MKKILLLILLIFVVTAGQCNIISIPDTRLYFSDDFNRSNENPISSNGWTTFGVSNGDLKIESNELVFEDTSPGDGTGYCYNSSRGFDVSRFPEISFTIRSNDWDYVSRFAFVFDYDQGGFWSNFPYIEVREIGASGNISVGDTAGSDSATITLNNSTTYNVEAQVSPINIKAKIWAVGDSEPTAWDVDYTVANGLSAGADDYLLLVFQTNDMPTPSIYFDDLTVQTK